MRVLALFRARGSAQSLLALSPNCCPNPLRGNVEIIGRTNANGDDEFVVRCEIHDWYFRGQPPLTHGCRECWNVYYFCQIAMAEGDKKTLVEQLESAIRHTCELADKGQWDFTPKMEIESIEKDAN